MTPLNSGWLSICHRLRGMYKLNSMTSWRSCQSLRPKRSATQGAFDMKPKRNSFPRRAPVQALAALLPALSTSAYAHSSRSFNPSGWSKITTKGPRVRRCGESQTADPRPPSTHNTKTPHAGSFRTMPHLQFQPGKLGHNDDTGATGAGKSGVPRRSSNPA